MRVISFFNIGGNCEQTNLQIVRAICDTVQDLVPNVGRNCRKLITFVKDRPGHDRRYAIDATKIQTELGWSPNVAFENGIRATVQWYLDNQAWLEGITTGTYQRERLGLAG